MSGSVLTFSCAPQTFFVPPYARAISPPDKHPCLIGGKGSPSSMLTCKPGTISGKKWCAGILGKFGSKYSKNRHFFVQRVHIQHIWTSQCRDTGTERHIFSINNNSVSIVVNTVTEGSLQSVTATVKCFTFCPMNNI